MITIVFVILVAFILLGFFAGVEMAYLSCNKLKLRHLADGGDAKAKVIMRFHREPKRFLTTILIGTNLMHVTVAGLATYLLRERFGIVHEWLITLVLAPWIIIFAETIPKDWFRHKADDFIYRFAPFLGFVYRLLSGFSRALLVITDFLTAATAPRLKRNPFVTREEFRYVIDESAKGGVLLEHERKLIDTILNLSSVRVDETMIPLVKFPKVPLTSMIRGVKETARRIHADVVLVYEEIPSLIVGLVYVFDILFEENEEQTLSRYLRAPLFVPHDTSSERALFLLQSKHASYAAVINADREVVGVVSVENLIQF